MAHLSYRDANRRYRRAFAPAIVIYIVLCFLGPLLLERWGAPALWLRAAIGIVTATPIAAAFWLIWRYVRETDEFTRARQTAALAGAGMITAAIAVTWGFLELYGVVPSMWTFLLGPAFFAAWWAIFSLRDVGQDAGRGAPRE